MTDGLAQIADGDRRGQAKALAEQVTDRKPVHVVTGFLLLVEGVFTPHFLEQLQASLIGEGKLQATLLPDAAQDVILCCEVSDLPLASAAGLLVSSRHYCVEVAHRLRSRIDVEWSAISQP